MFKHYSSRWTDFSIAAGIAVIIGFGGVATDAGAQTPSQSNPHAGHADLARLGQVDFKTSCNAAAQREFNTAMALLHSFAWERTKTAFDAVLQADPTCGMAHWGHAVTALDNPFIWPANLPPQKLTDIAGMLQAARTAGLKTPRETAYVDAVQTFVRDHEKLSHRERIVAYDAAMAKLAAANVDDKEAAILSALVTSANFNPADKTYANQFKAARALEPLFKAMPNHPGVAHYMIHSYDYPPIAKHGAEAARAYAKIAPDATHALHMPSHIFTRLGLWQESIVANRASAKSATAAQMDGHHANDYMVYAHLQLAQDKAAQDAMKASLSAKPVDHFAAAYAYAAMPARLALERGSWKQAAELELPMTTDYPWKKYPQAEAINAFARGIGAARSNDAAATRTQHARLITLKSAAEQAKLTYWAEQIDIQAAIIDALAQCADKKTDACIEGLRQAATREDATEKHVVTPGLLVPAREILAETLLTVAVKPAEALKEYEAVLAKEPNRFRAIMGVMYAARQSGNRAKAQAAARDLMKLGGKTDTGRFSLEQARSIVASR
jgi:hypothetical protein